ncbi:MAG: hypothetical protein WC827_03805 [Candidatus Paceibacterota bacterium]|jgi:hypothetical protein
MENQNVSIPEEIQQICRDFAEVAIKHGLYNFSGKFTHKMHCGGEVSFNWIAGRHEAKQNKLSISTQLFVTTEVIIKK